MVDVPGCIEHRPHFFGLVALIEKVGDAAQLVELQRDLAGEALMTSALALLVGRASDTSDLLHSFLKRWVVHTFWVLSALFARPRDGFWELEVETCMGMLVTSNPSGMCD